MRADYVTMIYRLFFIFVLVASDCRATDEIPPYDLPGYDSAFSPIVVVATVVALDEASPGKPAILKGHPARWDAIWHLMKPGAVFSAIPGAMRPE